ncbi:hypothetical protein AWH56_011290 [Anaerobacillus isosaccharinicus]|uniref:DUF3953 domain-containing protein n=1 Tax=Anaerobacillus isosaccharinicus TaxID=1532552 RepID=A0A1S2MGA8_9BACI|nr:hypothetical protein [Anaerobacillus isosaccharinicus]MBA5588512.1 hypothetical protein [Anaerobacillus isosaccharinicus]QOY38064.1 hypothetical protein AWH56_011290 [Anaerobacillus isosaccharinicus]
MSKNKALVIIPFLLFVATVIFTIVSDFTGSPTFFNLALLIVITLQFIAIIEKRRESKNFLFEIVAICVFLIVLIFKLV